MKHLLRLGLVGAIASVVLALGTSPAVASLTLPTPSPSLPTPTLPAPLPVPVPVPSVPAVTPPPVSVPTVSLPAAPRPAVSIPPVPAPRVTAPAPAASIPAVSTPVTGQSGGGSAPQSTGTTRSASGGSSGASGGAGRAAVAPPAAAANDPSGSSGPAAGSSSPASTGALAIQNAATTTPAGVLRSAGRLRGASALAADSWRSSNVAFSTSPSQVDDYLLGLVHDDLCTSLASILGPLPPRIDGLPAAVIRRLPAGVRQVVPLDVLSRATVRCESALFDASTAHAEANATLLALIRTGFMGLTLAQVGLGLLCIGALLRHHGRRRPAAVLPS